VAGDGRTGEADGLVDCGARSGACVPIAAPYTYDGDGGDGMPSRAAAE